MKKYTLLVSAWVLASCCTVFAADSDALQKLVQEKQDALSALSWIRQHPSSRSAQQMLVYTQEQIRELDQQIQEITGQWPDETELNADDGVSVPGSDPDWNSPWLNCLSNGEDGFGEFNDAPFSGGPGPCGF